MKRTPLVRKTPLAPGTSQFKRTPMKRGTTNLKRSAWVPKPTVDPITPAVRAEVERRSGGCCEARVTRRCAGVGQHMHHRKRRRCGDHRAVNLLYVCWACHNEIHAHPAMSYRYGFLVRQTDDPTTRLAGVDANGYP